MPGIQDAIAAIMAASGQEAPQEAPREAQPTKLPTDQAATIDLMDTEPEEDRNKPKDKKEEKPSEMNKETTSSENIKDRNEEMPYKETESSLVANPNLMEALRAIIALAMTNQHQGPSAALAEPVSQPIERTPNEVI